MRVQDVYKLNLYKLESRGGIEGVIQNFKEENVTFGFYDIMRISKIESTDKINELSRPDSLKKEGGTAVTESLIPIFDIVNPNNPLLREMRFKDYKEEIINKKFTLVSCIKLDERKLSSYRMDSKNKVNLLSIFYDIKDRINRKMDFLNENKENVGEIYGKVMFSSGGFDVIVFLAVDKPEINLVDILDELRIEIQEIQYSHSFMTYKYVENRSEDSTGYLETKARLILKLVMKRPFFRSDLDDLRDKFRQVVVGHFGIKENQLNLYKTTGDEDIVISIEGLRVGGILAFFSPWRELRGEILNDVERMSSKIEFEAGLSIAVSDEDRKQWESQYEVKDINEVAGPRKMKMNGNSEGLEISRAEIMMYLDKLHKKVKQRYEQLDIASTQIRDKIDQILEITGQLINLDNHYKVGYGFLSHLNYILKVYGRRCQEGGEVVKEVVEELNQPMLDLCSELLTALNNAGALSNNILDLYNKNADHKFLMGYRALLRSIYLLMPLKRRKEGKEVPVFLNAFITLGQEGIPKMKEYFSLRNLEDMDKAYEGDIEGKIDNVKRIVHFSMGDVTFFDITSYYFYSLHEIAHLQYTTQPDTNRINKILEEMAIKEITENMYRDYRRDGRKLDERAISREDILEDVAKNLSVSHGDDYKGMRTKEYKERILENIKDYKYKDGFLREILQNFREYEQTKRILREIDGRLDMYRRAIIEANSDMIMLEVALRGGKDKLDKQQALDKYIEFWDNHFKTLGTDVFNDELKEVSFNRFAFVFKALEFKENKKNLDKKGNFIERIEQYIDSIEPLTLPFVQYYQQWVESEGYKKLGEEVDGLWKGRLSGDVTGRSIPFELSLEELVELYMNYWLESITMTDIDIYNRMKVE